MNKRAQSKSPATAYKKARNVPIRHSGGKAAAHCVLRFQNEILIVRAKRKQVWQPPGGKLEAGESSTQGVLREVREETGLVLQAQ